MDEATQSKDVAAVEAAIDKDATDAFLEAQIASLWRWSVRALSENKTHEELETIPSELRRESNGNTHLNSLISGKSQSCMVISGRLIVLINVLINCTDFRTHPQRGRDRAEKG